jgi:hypothetical protein
MRIHANTDIVIRPADPLYFADLFDKDQANFLLSLLLKKLPQIEKHIQVSNISRLRRFSDKYHALNLQSL